MASIETRKGKKKTSYRVEYQLFIDGIPKKKHEPFDNKEDAEQFWTTAQAIEDKSKLSLVDPEEVSWWVERRYIKQEEAFKAFSLYAATVTAENKGAVPVDWYAIKERYEHNEAGGSQSTDFLTDNHRKRMSLYSKVEVWVKEHHADLQMDPIHVNDWQLELREDKIRASTRKHRFYCLRKIYKAAIELKMISHDPTQDAEKPRAPAAKRGSHKARAIFNESQVPELLEAADSMKGASWTQARPPQHTKKILNIPLEAFDDLPSLLTRSQVMDLLQISNATIIRYTRDGLLPKPDRQGSQLNGPWRMDAEALKSHLSNAQEREPEQMMLFTRKEEHSMMRGCFPLAVRCGLLAGLRNGECNWLPWHHVDIKAEELFIGQVISPLKIIWSPKTAVDEEEEGTEERTLGMSKELVRYFKYEKERQERLGIKTFFVFPSGHTLREVNHGKPITSSVLNQCFKKLIKHAGLTPSVRGKKFTFYSLRHTFCTMMLRQGVEIGTVSERMGHADIRTTQSYIHPQEAGAKVERAMDNLLKKTKSDDGL